MNDKIHFRYGAGGALVCDVPIEGVTQDLMKDTRYGTSVEFYGGRYFVGESITKSGARKLAELLGGVLDE
jgi:hypothetical protein